MSKIYYFFITVLLLSGVTPLMAQHDSTYYSKLLNERVWNISCMKDSDITWVIAGENRDKIFKIKNNKICNICEEASLPKGNIYTSILCINNRHALVGTKNNYLFYIRNTHKFKWLNQKYGLPDSMVISINFRKKEHMVIVTTPGSRYVLKHYKRPYNNYLTQVRDTTKTFDEIAYFFKHSIIKPFQQGLCFLASDIDLSFKKNKFIDDKTLGKIKQGLQPGDIFIKRNDDQLSNVGVPGFWTHAGIFVGSLDMLDSCFSDLPFLEGQKPSRFIQENYHKVYERMLNQKDLIIEAIGKGVVINPVEHIAKVDHLAVLRADLLSKNDLLQALFSAFDYYGAPYDYLFDFENDDALVCSELVYRAFLSDTEKKGIVFQFGTLGGKPFLSPNDIAKQYTDERKTDSQQLKLISFYDSDIHKRRSEKKSEHEFVKSWKRKD